MAFNYPLRARVPRQRKPEANFVFWQDTWGLVSAKAADMLTLNEATELTNVKLSEYGGYETRPGVQKISSAATGAAIKHIAKVPVGSNNYIFVVDADNKLYVCSGSVPNLDPGTAIATLEGEATIVPFNGYAVILDGSYIKLSQGTSVILAYDNGSGPRAYQYNNTCGTDNDASAVALYSGANTRAGMKETTQSWTAGYTIPLKGLDVWISKVGSPTGTVYAKLYDSTGATLLDTATTTYDASEFTTHATMKSFTFDGSYGLSPNTEYIFVIEYSGGDSSNYIRVHASNPGAGGNQVYYDGSWNTNTANSALMGFRPSRPPKGKFGDVKQNRLFVAGDPDYPGYVWFSNVNTAFDWSTTDGGGYVGAVDENANSFAVGGIVAHFGDLYVFGTDAQPYLCKLSGASPSNYTLPTTFQHVYTNHKTLLSIPNDVWFVSGGGVSHLQGVQEYGDLRTFSASDQIADKVTSYWDTDAFAAYIPKDGQYIVKLTGYSKLLVCHVRQPKQGQTGHVIYPWTEYELNGITPTCLATVDDELWLGASDGYIYRFTDSVVTDDGNDVSVSLKTGIVDVPFGSLNIDRFYTSISSSASTNLTMYIYKNGTSTSPLTKSITAGDAPIQGLLNYNCDSFQIKLGGLTYSAKVRFGPLMIMGRKLSHREA